ncbi:MAG: DeoR/GlpR family DNA-binding transcription regulator [Lachnospiraceae bacterium]|nr:DeoR/GlpR family DNA-binding transcription regulator [Lachnospiraceae bacterium]
MAAVKSMTVEERQNAICAYVNDLKRVHTNDLINHFDASASTIRNDLVALERSGLIRRTHGMVLAVNVAKVADELTVANRMEKNMPEKMAIATLANREIDDGDVILLMTGSTITCLAKTLINKHNLTVVVNDVKIAEWLLENTNHKVFIIGGFVRRDYYCVDYDESITKHINVDKVFFSSSGFSVEKGVTTSDFNLAASERKLMECTNKNYFLCDSSKFGQVKFAKICDVSEIDMMITDAGIPEEYVDKLREVESLRFAVAEKTISAPDYSRLH